MSCRVLRAPVALLYWQSWWRLIACCTRWVIGILANTNFPTTSIHNSFYWLFIDRRLQVGGFWLVFVGTGGLIITNALLMLLFLPHHNSRGTLLIVFPCLPPLPCLSAILPACLSSLLCLPASLPPRIHESMTPNCIWNFIEGSDEQDEQSEKKIRVPYKLILCSCKMIVLILLISFTSMTWYALDPLLELELMNHVSGQLRSQCWEIPSLLLILTL